MGVQGMALEEGDSGDGEERKALSPRCAPGREEGELVKIGFWITWLLNRLQVLMESLLAVSLGWGGGSCFLNRRGLLSLL